MENEKNIMEQLQAPFHADEIEWRVQQCGIINNKPWVMVLAYIQNRAIMNRLDEVLGIGNWKNEFIKWGTNSNLCGLSCRINGEWIAKWDGADETDIEPTKGGLSDSMKRAAVQWGIGRYLYNLTEAFTDCSIDRQNGKEWRKAKTKEKDIKYIYWKIPTLPSWALPAGESTQKPPKANNTPPKKDTQSANPIETMIKYLNDLGIDFTIIENAYGMPIDACSSKEIAEIKQALKDSKKQNISFDDAFNQVLTVRE